MKNQYLNAHLKISLKGKMRKWTLYTAHNNEMRPKLGMPNKKKRKNQLSILIFWLYYLQLGINILASNNINLKKKNNKLWLFSIIFIIWRAAIHRIQFVDQSKIVNHGYFYF